MRRRKRYTSSIVAILLVICLGSTSYASDMINEESDMNVTDSYVYPLISEDEDGPPTIREMIEIYRIPESILHDMSDEQLIQATMDFPFVHEVYMYNDVETGVQSLENVSDAYKELINRETGFESLMKYFKQESAKMEDELTTELAIKIDYLAAMIVFQEKFKDFMTIEDLHFITNCSTMIDYNIVEEASTYGAVVPGGSGPITPKGNAVPYVTNSCNHPTSNYHAIRDQEMVSDYKVKLISSGTCKYNCHSYAWYSTSTSNQFWIDSPAKYMTDGSYTKILTGASSSSAGVAAGCKLFYGTHSDLARAHSAIIVENASNIALGARIVRSKWGNNGVFEHVATNVPPIYDTSNLSAWSR